MSWLTILSLVSAVMSLGVGAAARRALSQIERLQPIPDPPRLQVDVLVPARNERRDLAKSLRSILAQESVQLRILVINDHSTDGTGELADEIAAEDSRVTVLHDPPLAPGWLGKVNALQYALARTSAPFVIATDADVEHAPQCFSAVLTAMQQRQLDLLSICPRFQFVSFWENVLLPHATLAGTAHFLLLDVNRDDSNNAAAAGALIAMQRESLQQMGGFESVRHEMVDDIELAKRFKERGFRTRFLLGPHLIHVRLFKGNRDAFWGLTKNILGAFGSVWTAVAAMFLPWFVYWIPLAAVITGWWAGDWWRLMAGLTAYLTQAALLWIAKPICEFQWLKALCFPLSPLPVCCCIAVALYHRLATGSVSWRGRVIAVGKK